MKSGSEYDYYLTCCGLCCGADIIPCGGIIFRYILRDAIIEKYGIINEDPVTSFGYTCCCMGCSQCQMLNEIMVIEVYRRSHSNRSDVR